MRATVRRVCCAAGGEGCRLYRVPAGVRSAGIAVPPRSGSGVRETPLACGLARLLSIDKRGHAGETPHDAHAIPRPFGARSALAHGAKAVFELLPGVRQRSALLLRETTQDAHPADDCQKGRPRSLGRSAQERRVAHATVPDDAHLVRPKWTTQVLYLCRRRGAILVAREALVPSATHPVSLLAWERLKENAGEPQTSSLI